MHFNNKALWLATAGIVALVAAGSATAQTSAVNAASETRKAAADTTVGELIVTAQRRSERLQDVPLSIAAASGEQLAAAGVHRIEDLGDRTPGVYFKSANVAMPNVAIRGIGSTQIDNSAEAPVGLFIDDVYISNFTAGLSGLYDIDRVELLRGPQGTLYGRNTIGGAINVITRDPTRQLDGTVEAEMGSYGAVRSRAAVGGPLTDTLSGRIAFASNNREGWTRDTVTGQKANDEKNVAGRVKLLLEPSAHLRFKLTADYSRDDNADFLQEIKGTINLGIAPPEPELTPDQPYVSQSDVVGHQRRTIWSTSLKSDVDLSDSVALTAITAYQHHAFDGLRDLDAGPVPLLAAADSESGYQVSQEVRLASTGASALKWLVGAYYFDSASGRTERWTLGGLFPARAVFAGDYIWTFDAKARSYAAFGQVSYAFTPQLELIGGLRYSHDHKEGDYLVRSTAAASLPSFVSPGAGFTTPVSADWHSLDPAITLNYRPNDAVLLYGSYKTGFKSGGFQDRPSTLAVATTPYAPENLKAWEGGAKTQWFDRRLTANLSAFDYDYRNLQQLVLAPNSTLTITDNVGRAKVRGAELEVVARPVPSFDFNLGYSFLDATYGDYVDNAKIQRAGNRLSRAPRNTVNLAGQYTVDTARGDLRFRLEYLWRDEIFFNADNAPVSTQKPVGLLNARIAFTTMDERLTLALQGSNLTKEVYCDNEAVSVPSSSASRCFVGAPRQISIGLKYNFR